MLPCTVHAVAAAAVDCSGDTKTKTKEVDGGRAVACPSCRALVAPPRRVQTHPCSSVALGLVMSDIVMSAVYEQAAVCAAVGYSMENCYIRRAGSGKEGQL